MEYYKYEKKPRVLCLHGSASSAEILKKEVVLAWPEIVLEKLDLVFLNGSFLLKDKKDVHDIFYPPYYTWFQGFEVIYHFEDCIQYIEDFMETYGPFDGVLGFSMGAIIAASMPGMQRERVALTKVPKIKFVIIISGAKLGGEQFGCPTLAANAFSIPIECPSLHFFGEKDFAKSNGEELVECFVNPVMIHHPEGHKIPNLDAKSMETVIAFIDRVKKIKLPLQAKSNL